MKKPTVIKGGKKSIVKHKNTDRRKRKAPKLSTREAVKQAPGLADQGTAPSYKVYYVVIKQIKVASPRRQINPQKVKELKESIAEIGLRTPITVRVVDGTKHLIAGLHRLAAVKALGWEKIPVVKIKGGKKVARLWEISENLHRAELTAVEESRLIVEWLELTGAEEVVSVQNGQKKEPGRPKGGISAAAAKLPGKGTVTAKRKQITRALKIDKIDPEVKQAAVDAGFADNRKKLGEIAEEKGKDAQLKKLEQLKAARGKTNVKSSTEPSNSAGAQFDVMARRWRKKNVLRRADWEKASVEERSKFITKVLKHP
jgi:ParB-like nuclease domain